MQNKYKIFILIVAVICIAQLGVILLSWVASAMFPNGGIHSLLASEGLRWLLSSYEANVNTSIFFYFLLACFGIGAFIRSGLAKKMSTLTTCNYNERLAITLFLVGVFVALVLCVIFALYPHSFLLSIEGTLCHGPYFKAVLLVFCFVLVTGSCLYVFLTNRVDVCKNLVKSLTSGLQMVVPFMVIYFLTMELISTVLYVLK